MLKLFRVLRPYYMLLAGVVVVLFGQAMAELALPTLMADVVNNGMLKGDTDYIMTFGGYMLMVALASTSFSIVASFLSSIVGMRFGRDIRSLVFTHVENFSLTEFDQIGTASLITRTTNDITQVQTLLAALTSAVSVLEAVVSSLMDEFKLSRAKATIIESTVAMVVGIIVCLGYNSLYFEVTLPNGSIGQILDILDYISNNVLMPVCEILTCVLIGWVVTPKTVIDEVVKNGEKFGRKGLYVVMIKYVAPLLLFVLLLKSIGLLNLI